MICFTVSAIAQEDSRRLLVGINFSADYCYRTLKVKEEFFNSESVISFRNNIEQPNFGYTTGINVCITGNKNLGIEGGIQFSNKSYGTKKQELIWGDVLDPRYGFVYDTTIAHPTFLSNIYDYYYFDIPIRVIYSLGQKRLRLIASAGLTTNIFLKATNTAILEYENGDIERKTQDDNFEYNAINLSPTISLGIDYRLSNSFNLRVEPTARYGILKIIDAPLTGYLWNAGLNVSCYYAIR